MGAVTVSRYIDPVPFISSNEGAADVGIWVEETPEGVIVEISMG